MKFNKLLLESQFHGGRRLAEKNCRWCWSLSILMLFGSAVAVICVTVRRFLDNPTFLVQLETIQNTMDFPSVLVCPEVFFTDDKVDQFLSNLCRWQGADFNCSEIFHLELTGDGYCCVFNGRALRRKLKRRTWRTQRFGYNSGLMLAVNQSQTLNNIDLSYKWLALQSSRHFVETTVNGTALNPGNEQWVEYHIRNFQIAEDARSLSDFLRKCRMAYEPLKYFPIYDKKYCILECEIAYTLRRCGCVRRAHPLPKGASYCSARRLLCAKHAKVSYDSDQCDCPPACDVATDFTKVGTSTNLQSTVRPIDTFYDDLDFEKTTIVRVYVQSNLINTNSRRSYFRHTDLFAQLGGVFNVFFGCSILTMLELLLLAFYGCRKILALRWRAHPNDHGKKLRSIVKCNKDK